MNNKGFDSVFDEKDGNKGVDIAGEAKVRPKSKSSKSKFHPKWSSVVFKTSSLEMCELSKKSKAAITDVHDAVREGTFDLLEQAISKAKKNRSLDDLDDIGLSNLHHAVRYNRVEAVASLLKHGAQVNILTRDEENTPLHISSRYGWLDSTKQLLEHGANPNICNVNGVTPLHLACRRGNKEVVSTLLDNTRIQVNIPDKSLMIPLHVAATQGDGELCQMLMDKGADYQAKAADKMTPLLAAVANGNQAAADAIFSKVVEVSENDVSFITKDRDIDSNTILHLAALTNNLEIAKKIVLYERNVNIPTNSFVTPLHVAAGKGHLEMVELLVENGADIYTKSFDGRTSLHKAASFGYNNIISFLINKGAVVDAGDYINKTPFLVAVESGQTESALLLLSKGANINAYDAMVKNCLHLAIENDHLDTLKVILEEPGCIENLNSPDIQERVPLHYAAMCTNSKVLHTVLAKQTRFAFQDENQQTPMYLAAESGRVDHVEALGQAGSPINERDDEGKTALHAAAARGHKKVCLKLLKLGADINYRDNNRSTPLMWASKQGYCKTCEALLESGARIDDVNNHGETALLEGIRYNHVHVVDMLLDAGASILLRNNDNMGVIDVAVRWGSNEAAMSICKHPRWREVLEDTSGPYQHTPMKLLIAHFPEAAKVVMDQCVYPVSQTSSTHPDYAVQYDFYLLDPGPDDPAALKGNRYFGPKTMVKSQRSDLLLHPLTQMLLKKKWATIGRFLYSLNFFTYFIFIISYSAFLILERKQIKFTQWQDQNSTGSASSLYNKSGLSQFFPIFVMSFAVFHMVKEIVQMFFQGKTYFTELSNALEWTLYGTVVVFLVPYVASTSWVDEFYGQMSDPINMWIIGIISIFLCYVNFVLFLRRLAVFGLYITMHIEVMKTLLRVMLVFSVFLISFNIVFFILFKEQDVFRSFGISLMKTTVMMLGEIDFSDVFVSTIESTTGNSKQANPQNPFPELAFTFLFLFIFIMCIALMNLLVGLAVGDIDKVQREATLQGQAMQVEFVGQLEDKYPRVITRLVYKKFIVDHPNKVGRFARILSFFARSTTSSTDSLTTNDDNDSYKELRRDLTKTKKRVKSIMVVLEAQNKLLKNLAKKIDPSSFQGDDLSDVEDVISPQRSLDDFATPASDNQKDVISSL